MGTLQRLADSHLGLTPFNANSRVTLGLSRGRASIVKPLTVLVVFGASPLSKGTCAPYTRIPGVS